MSALPRMAALAAPLALLAAGLAGCAYPYPEPYGAYPPGYAYTYTPQAANTAGGALIGAGAGAALGGLAGGGQGAAIGALAGGALGAAVGASSTPPPAYHYGYGYGYGYPPPTDYYGYGYNYYGY